MFDIIIIGGGVAGMTSALYSLRNNKSVLILEKESIGGQIAKSPRVENFPTVKKISGEELSFNLFEQISELGVKFELEDVEKVEKIDNIFHVKTNYNNYEAKSVIIATGASPRKLNITGEDKLLGHGVFYCAICDGPFYSGKDVTLIGDANSALQYALMLSQYCNKVTIFTMFDKFFGEQTIIDEVRKTPNIEIKKGCYKAYEFVGEKELEKILFEKDNSEKIEYQTNAVFVAIGQVPNNDVFKNLVDLDKNGYIIADENCRTNVDGLFVAGDCRTKKTRQVTTAMSDGAVAGMNASMFVNSQK